MECFHKNCFPRRGNSRERTVRSGKEHLPGWTRSSTQIDSWYGYRCNKYAVAREPGCSHLRLRDSISLLTSHHREMFIGIIEKPMAIPTLPMCRDRNEISRRQARDEASARWPTKFTSTLIPIPASKQLKNPIDFSRRPSDDGTGGTERLYETSFDSAFNAFNPFYDFSHRFSALYVFYLWPSIRGARSSLFSNFLCLFTRG